VDIAHDRSAKNGHSPKTLVYVAGPYRAPTEAGVRENIHRAWLAARTVWRLGAIALCPHKNSEGMGGDVPDEAFVAAGCRMVELSDAVWRLPGASEGASAEVAHAKAIGRRVLYSEDEVRAFLAEGLFDENQAGYKGA